MMSVTSRACPATSPSSLPRAYLIGRPAICCGVVLPVCPCVGVVFQAPYGWNSTGPTPTRTPTPTLGMRLSCNFVNVYSTRAHARIPNGHPREENRAACRTSRRGSLCVSGLWTILARKSARMSVSLSVSAPWNASLRARHARLVANILARMLRGTMLSWNLSFTENVAECY